MQKNLLRKREGKMPLRRPKRKWEYNIKRDRRKLGLGGVNWVHLAVGDSCEERNESLGSVKCG